MEVMHSFQEKYGTPNYALSFSRWLSSVPLWAVLALCLIFLIALSVNAFAQSTAEKDSPFQVLLRWIPLLLTSGFSLNVLISFLTMGIATVGGVIVGLTQISPYGFIRIPGKIFTQAFRNSPWLVTLYIIMFSFPNELTIFGQIVPFPNWIKAVMGLTLPVMANVSEIVRGAIQSVPTGQWEAAEASGFSRQQILWRIILPQCIKRMIPPWMNWYAILTMATPLVSILGVREMVTTIQLAFASEGDRPDLLLPFFGFCLVTFFVYCYPIARLTIRLEKRFAVKL